MLEFGILVSVSLPIFCNNTSYTWIPVSVEIVHLILFGPAYRNRFIKGLPVEMVVRDAMYQYMNTELAEGAVYRNAMDQYVNIMLSNGPYFYKFFFSGIMYSYLFFFLFIGHNFECILSTSFESL
jgi:hypothetical protein